MNTVCIKRKSFEALCYDSGYVLDYKRGIEFQTSFLNKHKRKASDKLGIFNAKLKNPNLLFSR